MGRLLQDVALRARLEAAPEQRALGVGGEDQHLRVRHLRREELRGLEPVHAGHPHVHDHDVGLAPLRELDRGLAVRGLADDAYVRRAREGKTEPFADDFVVVDDQRRDLVSHGG